MEQEKCSITSLVEVAVLYHDSYSNSHTEAHAGKPFESRKGRAATEAMWNLDSSDLYSGFSFAHCVLWMSTKMAALRDCRADLLHTAWGLKRLPYLTGHKPLDTSCDSQPRVCRGNHFMANLPNFYRRLLCVYLLHRSLPV